MHFLSQRIIGGVIIVSWIFASSICLPLPNRAISQLTDSYIANQGMDRNSADFDERLDSIKKQVSLASKGIWIEWWLKVILVINGLIAGMAAMKGVRYSDVLIVTTSALYIVGWFFKFQSGYGPLSDSWLSWANAVASSDDSGSILVFAMQDLMLPILYLAVIVWVLRYYPLVKRNNGD